MRPKDSHTREELRRMVQRQAWLFQSNPTYWHRGYGNFPPFCLELLSQLTLQKFQADGPEILKHTLQFPTWDEQGIPTDIPELRPCNRIYGIANNPVFPPLWQLQACRTILPEALPEQLGIWKAWIQDLAEGKHQSYLLDLALVEITSCLYYQWQGLHHLALTSIPKQNAWAINPEVGRIREEILHLQPPRRYFSHSWSRDFGLVDSIPLEPPKTNPKREPIEVAEKQELLNSVLESGRELTRCNAVWNSLVKKNWKLNGFYDCPNSLEGFFQQHTQELPKLFLWLERCAELGFGLYLDY